MTHTHTHTHTHALLKGDPGASGEAGPVGKDGTKVGALNQCLNDNSRFAFVCVLD